MSGRRTVGDSAAKFCFQRKGEAQNLRSPPYSRSAVSLIPKRRSSSSWRTRLGPSQPLLTQCSRTARTSIRTQSGFAIVPQRGGRAGGGHGAAASGITGGGPWYRSNGDPRPYGVLGSPGHHEHALLFFVGSRLHRSPPREGGGRRLGLALARPALAGCNVSTGPENLFCSLSSSLGLPH